MAYPLHDVIIIGAGPAGSTTATFLAQHGLDVLLLDKAVFPRDKTCGDGLTPRAIDVLAELGLMEALTAEGCSMSQAQVIAPNGRPVTLNIPQRDDLPTTMLAIPRLKLDEMIRQRALAAGVRYQDATHVTDITYHNDGITVHGRRGSASIQHHGRMAVIAVGAAMKLLMQLGILREPPLLTLAARAYYEDVQNLSGRFEFYFEGVPLPGYGWVFPLSPTSANIGAGIFVSGWSKKHKHTAQAVLKQFLQVPVLREMLAHARQTSPVRGYPIRTDFATAATYTNRVLLVGEAAGLVNPLTGEGVDYALESGKIAAAHLCAMFDTADFSEPRLHEYDAALRSHFHEQVVFCNRIRDWYLHRPIINRIIRAANKRPHIRELFTDVVLGNRSAADAMTLKTITQIILP